MFAPLETSISTTRQDCESTVCRYFVTHKIMDPVHSRDYALHQRHCLMFKANPTVPKDPLETIKRQSFDTWHEDLKQKFESQNSPHIKDPCLATLSKAEYVGFCKGNVLMYITDPNHQDYKKARYYLDKLIECYE